MTYEELLNSNCSHISLHYIEHIIIEKISDLTADKLNDMIFIYMSGDVPVYKHIDLIRKKLSPDNKSMSITKILEILVEQEKVIPTEKCKKWLWNINQSIM